MMLERKESLQSSIPAHDRIWEQVNVVAEEELKVDGSALQKLVALANEGRLYERKDIERQTEETQHLIEQENERMAFVRKTEEFNAQILKESESKQLKQNIVYQQEKAAKKTEQKCHYGWIKWVVIIVCILLIIVCLIWLFNM